MSALPVIFDEDGLIPAVIQDVDTGVVLMMAYMNAEALERTRATGKTHFWSRSRRTLWQKGETSGHVQLVKSIAVNCYENCLLVRVQQIGACCHTGFPTCFFREIDVDGSLVTVQERSFDPDSVYGSAGDLQRTAELWVGAYRYLADHDLASESRTSRLLRQAQVGELTARVADELDELAGVLRGDHVHANPADDTLLEATQVLYWATAAAIRAGFGDHQIVASVLAVPESPIASPAEELAVVARKWRAIPAETINAELPGIASVISATLSQVGLSLASAFASDLAELRAKPYLEPYFTAPQEATSPDS